MNIKEYIEEIEQINQSNNLLTEKYLLLKRLLERICKKITENETMQFSNLFSRLVILSQQFNLPKYLEWRLQHFRVQSNNILSNKEKELTEDEYAKAEQTLLDFCRFISGEKTVSETYTPEKLSTLQYDKLRVIILSIDYDNNLLKCAVESLPEKVITVKYNVNPINDDFNVSASRFWKGAQLNLIDCIADNDGHLIPKYFILEPDYLIDASQLAECFHNFCISPLLYFKNKFDAKENRKSILLGNLANYFLDVLIFAENIDNIQFKEVFFNSFKETPIEYTTCEDIRNEHEFRAFIANASLQFQNIKRVIKHDFPECGIQLNNCTLEPSFFSEKFGFQGRLDLLQLPNHQNSFKIIELKSGGLPYPKYNKNKISINHEVQTSIYRLMIESVFDQDSRKIKAAILYSSAQNPGENLRFAAAYQHLDKQILDIRNQIIANEHTLVNGTNESVEQMFGLLFQSLNPSQPNFFTSKIISLKESLINCYTVELSYFYRFIRFISREIYLQKIGDTNYESPTGMASLWNSNFNERDEALDVIFDLSIYSINNFENGMTIIFKRNKNNNDLANFRNGDICIVYPRKDPNETVLNNQILKGNVAHIDAEIVEVNFRHKQKNMSFFKSNPLWAIEHDRLDTSYNNMYKSLFEFLKAPKQKRNLLLGLQAPMSENIQFKDVYPENLIQKAIAAKDYFLIVGPPGTGKTSIFARRLIEEYYAKEDVNILVLAYTNRAVDELCDAVNVAFGHTDEQCDKFIRIGSNLSCSDKYRHRLLQNISQKAEDRKSIRLEIEQTRIFVSTLASIASRMDLFQLKHFQIAIIDEASQILEPQIIGLLPKFDKFILIGDHNQLSTIVLQKQICSKITEPELINIGITDCKDSFFERLLRSCIEQNWTQSYSSLTVQGRMHTDISAFPSKYFYSGQLFPANEWQHDSWNLKSDSLNDIFHQTVAKERIAFFSTENTTANSFSDKTNEFEAETIVNLINAIRDIYKINNKELNANILGIIAPYRNQIAMIRHKLIQADIPNAENIMIDTVERFQGSQRDIILLSFCINKPYQLDFLSNLSHDGKVDRKLNVALTRARQQLYLVGNIRLISKHPIYNSLLQFLKDRTYILN